MGSDGSVIIIYRQSITGYWYNSCCILDFYKQPSSQLYIHNAIEWHHHIIRNWHSYMDTLPYVLLLLALAYILYSNSVLTNYTFLYLIFRHNAVQYQIQDSVNVEKSLVCKERREASYLKMETLFACHIKLICENR